MAARAVSPEFVFSSAGNDDSILEDDPSNASTSGINAFLQSAHNLEDRSSRPLKKRKLDERFDQPTSTFGATSKNGIIAEHVKEVGKASSKAPVDVVDLTADQEEDVVVLHAVDNLNTEVCFGRLDNARVNAHMMPHPAKKMGVASSQRTLWPVSRVGLQRIPGQNAIIMVLDPQNNDFGNVDVRSALVLAPILDGMFPGMRADARLQARARGARDMPGELISQKLDLMINLYGPKKHLVGLGNFLRQRHNSLSNPFMVEAGVEVHNPLASSKPSMNRLQKALTSSKIVVRTAEEVKNDVAGIFDSLSESEHLHEMEADPRIKTPLLPHQKQGLHFLLAHEHSAVADDDQELARKSLWQVSHRPNGSQVYFHVITGHEERERPEELRGGILADMMGLGKTLSILSLIVATLNEAQQFAASALTKEPTTALPQCAKTTLIIAPLTVVPNWEDQIDTHMEPGTLSCYVYHGSQRTQCPVALSHFDVIITTYQIVSNEVKNSNMGGKSPLLDLRFFRVVLDEAHAIRGQTTQQSQATCALHAQRRWALTGTPIQNRLEDLGALIKFLRVKPFDEKRNFAQHILAPFKSADPDILPKVRVLVDSIMLRRLKDRIGLPPRTDNVVRLVFSKDEQELYAWFAQDAQNRVRAVTDQKRGALAGRTHAHILQCIRRLRMICVGREMLSEDDLKTIQGFSSANAIDIEADDAGVQDALPTHKAYEMLMLCRESNSDQCSQCGKQLEAKEAGEDGDQAIGTMLSCFHMLCNDCSPRFRKSVQSAAGNRILCPFCDSLVANSFFGLTQKGLEKVEAFAATSNDHPRKAKVLGRYQGPHSKVHYLLCDLEAHRVESSRLPNEPPIKSVVFSCWTSNLDLIQIALEERGISFVRLDGTMSLAQRSDALHKFRDDSQVELILVSISAGGQGLNLTAASKVYMMEPQYNPAAEAQAMDRVHRLGQRRPVTTTRFLMEGSIEERIRELQERKESLAQLTLTRAKMDKEDVARAKLEQIKSLFG